MIKNVFRIQNNVYLPRVYVQPPLCAVLKNYMTDIVPVRNGDADAIKKLVEGGVSVNSLCPAKQSILMYLILNARDVSVVSRVSQ